MIGEQLGPYRIVREIGRGGMGSVWLGEHVELGQRVAIKVLLPQVAQDADLVQRFFNEARAAASVKHPGIVQVLDFGRAPGGAAYLAMELLEGETLRARLRARGALDADDAAMIARQVATTLGAAHDAGVVHRDLKPDNIMLVPDPETASGERPKVLDFGIAKLAEDRWDGSGSTRTGQLLGTPHYMSPEQCRGTGEVDGRTDVYALGCILFELVCGRPPFVSAGLGEIVGMHQFVPAPAPRSVRADVPEWLEQVILRALAKDPDRRYASMDELARALEGGGVPAARLARASEPPSTEHAVALAETIATPGGVQALAAAEVMHLSGDDVASIQADAQRRALALAETIAREQRDKGSLGKRVTVIAVAVVVLAALVLYVRFGGRDEPREERVAAKDDDGVGGPTTEPIKAEVGSGTGTDLDTRTDTSGGGLVDEVRAPDAGVPLDARPRPPSRRDAAMVANVPLDAAPEPDAVPEPPPDAAYDPNKTPEVLAYLKLLDDAAELFNAGKRKAAMKLLMKAYAMFPEDAQVLQMLILQSCRADDGDAARRYYEQLFDESRRIWLYDECKRSGVVVPEP